MSDPEAANPGRNYQVVRNHEDQYSIYPHELPLPPGWDPAGPSGPEQECLDYIETVWTDMTPRSVRLRAAGGS